MRMVNSKIVIKGNPQRIRFILKYWLAYYGKDAQIRDIISANITPNQQYALRDSGRVYK